MEGCGKRPVYEGGETSLGEGIDENESILNNNQRRGVRRQEELRVDSTSLLIKPELTSRCISRESFVVETFSSVV